MTCWKKLLKDTWYFIAHDNSALSWVVNFILAFLIVKFIIYPLLALILGSSLPLVAVVSGSMDHVGMDYDSWWEDKGQWYIDHNISKEEFSQFSFPNGFQKGDVMVLGRAKDLKAGDVLVYQSTLAPYPIIHRVVSVSDVPTYQVKGDHNGGPDPYDVSKEQVLGKALYRIPKIGWIKIWFSQLTGL